MNEASRTALEAVRPQARNVAWQTPRGLSRAQLDAAARVIRAHAERIASRRDEDRANHVGRPIEH
jgi:hypothetical protein